MHANPYPTYRQLRDKEPLHWDPLLSGWVLTRYDDVAMVLNDHRFSSSRVARARQRFEQPELQPLFDTLAARMSERDEPDHKRLRQLVHDAFVRSEVQRWEPRIQQRVDELLDAAVTPGRMEFIAEFAVPLPTLVIMEIVGIPAEHRQMIKNWCDDFAVVALNFFADITTDQLQQGLRSTLAFREYLSRRIRELEASPEANLLSELVHARSDNQRLTLDELLANTLLLLAAGNETTTCLLGNGLAALLRHPEQAARLRSDPSLIPNAVEEFLRYDSPVQFLGRLALDDVPMHGQTIRRGDLVLAVIGAANHDPERFESPEQLDVGRPHIPHLAFGHGPHFCAGSQLARLEARVAFTTLLSRFDIQRSDTTEPLSYRETFNIRCLRELPLRLKAC